MRFAILLVILWATTVAVRCSEAYEAESKDAGQTFTAIKVLLQTHCERCHSTRKQAGELDLERFTSIEKVRSDLKPWQAMVLQLESREMPPKGETQPTEAERTKLLDWTRSLLNVEARKRAGDPGRVPLRRLSHAEYDNTIRDLTSIDLRPTREFPADGAAGEGFTNAAEALTMSPALMEKYVDASRETAAHAVLLPDGFRFSPSSSSRDWADESVAKMRTFYEQFTPDGNLPLERYVGALVRHRQGLAEGTKTLNEVATEEKLSPKYLAMLWEALNGAQTAYPLDGVRAIWKSDLDNKVPAIVGEVQSWREKLWNFEPIGSYRSLTRQIAKEIGVSESATVEFAITPEPGQDDVVLHLVARSLGETQESDHVVWDNPRFVGNDLPELKLRNYADFGPQYEVDYSNLFAGTSNYLTAAIEGANDPELSAKALAEKHRLDEEFLKHWLAVLETPSFGSDATASKQPGRVVPAIDWKLLDEAAPNAEYPEIAGWRPKGADLPVAVSNASDEVRNVPGRIPGRGVAVHPMPTEFVAAVWRSPMAGKVKVSGKVVDAHSACGNGVAWWLEVQTPSRSAILSEGVVDLGKESPVTEQTVDVKPGDVLFLAIDARDSSHVCDLTDLKFTIAEVAEKDGRVWDLAADVANRIKEGNPLADRLGNKEVWRFVRGASEQRKLGEGTADDGPNLLKEWRQAAADPARKQDVEKLGKQLQALLTGDRPVEEASPEQKLYDQLLATNGPLLKGLDAATLAKPISTKVFGVSPQRFGKHPQGEPVDEQSFVSRIGEVVEIRLPAELFRDRKFVVEGKLSAESRARVVQMRVAETPPAATTGLEPALPVVAIAGTPGHKQFLAGLAEFRDLFPPYICYPHIIPLDEVVCLKTYHREDEPLIRLFLNEEQKQTINHLWEQHRFVAKTPIVENEYLPLFIGFVTQDQPQSLVDFFEEKRPFFQQRADEFQRDYEAAAPVQIQQLQAFAARAYRRPLTEHEVAKLESLYLSLREQKLSHEDAFRSVIGRVLIAPEFLLHLEQAPSGKKAGPVNDWELASRLSYFLWSSLPDAELRQVAASGKLHEPDVLAEQTRRMLTDPRVRGLAIEFGAQSLHVRDFDQFDEKNETLFPEFDEPLKQAMYEEVILFYEDLFRNDRSVTQVLDADHTFLNERLAQHYGIDGVTGEEFRRVDGIGKYGRGGILGFGSVQAKQAGASRTSPVLRGNWVVETLLGEKLPQPPPNIPDLPESEIGNDGLTMRQVVEKHVSAAECAICHQRIDPYGFAFEEYDAIGRRRQQDANGLPLDATAELRDGTQFTGLDGLRDYLLTQRKKTFVRLFYQRLLGYALGRSTSLSDQLLIDEMMEQSEQKNGSISTAVLKIVNSEQFRMIRGRDYAEDESTPPTEN